MKFPVVKGDKMAHPRIAKCPQCKKRKVGEPHSMAILSGGALLLDRKRENSIHTKALSGFLKLIWHGAHDDGEGSDRDIGAMVEIAQDATGGQFDLYFCSPACVRAFLNSWVDALEKCILSERRRLPQSPKQQKRELNRFLNDMRKRGLLEE
jgi:hypothetical protein